MRSSAVLALLPPDAATPLERVGAVVEARARVVVDEESREMVVELTDRAGEQCLGFTCATPLPWLVVHLRDVGKYCDVEVAMLDASGKLYNVRLSGATSTIRVAADSAMLPLHTHAGAWNRVPLHLPTLLSAAFGREYQSCVGVVVHAACRVSRIFFQSADFADSELPPLLRVLRDGGSGES